MKKFAVILAGCGQHDGSETHEVILTLLPLDQEGIKWHGFAPDIKQSDVINHVTVTTSPNETRSVMEESARLVRGRISPLSQANLDDFDAVIFPGGAGAVKNLCNWAKKQTDFEFEPSIRAFIDKAVKLKKPMGFICIAPMMIPGIYKSARFTIGNDAALNQQIKDMGCQPVNCSADDIVVDEVHKIVSTPANMVAKNIDEVYTGIRKLVKELKRMAS